MIKWLCKIIGHKFGGYEPDYDLDGKVIQAMPTNFYCLRCKCVTSVYEGWN